LTLGVKARKPAPREALRAFSHTGGDPWIFD
jgi:hypothetical protein